MEDPPHDCGVSLVKVVVKVGRWCWICLPNIHWPLWFFLKTWKATSWFMCPCPSGNCQWSLKSWWCLSGPLCRCWHSRELCILRWHRLRGCWADSSAACYFLVTTMGLLSDQTLRLFLRTYYISLGYVIKLDGFALRSIRETEKLWPVGMLAYYSMLNA